MAVDVTADRVKTSARRSTRSPSGVAHSRPTSIKVIASAGGGRILGAAIVGRDAGELIAPWSLAVANRLGPAAMQAFVPAYPTRSEISRRVVAATGAGPASLAPVGLTPQWRKRIIGLFRKLG